MRQNTTRSLTDSPAARPAWIDRLQLSTLDPDRQAAVAIASIPLPREDHAMVERWL